MPSITSVSVGSVAIYVCNAGGINVLQVSHFVSISILIGSNGNMVRKWQICETQKSLIKMRVKIIDFLRNFLCRKSRNLLSNIVNWFQSDQTQNSTTVLCQDGVPPFYNVPLIWPQCIDHLDCPLPPAQDSMTNDWTTATVANPGTKIV